MGRDNIQKTLLVVILSAIFNAIAAVIGCIVGAIITAATLGAGTAIGATIIALSVAACVCTLASSGCQIAAICTDDPEVKDKLNKASMGLGICGAVIGLERRKRFKDAGIRTHLILAIGCAMIMIVSKYAFSDILDYDAARIASNVVSGDGFLGAGVIFVKSGSVRGLTTAAGLWTTACIGLCCGIGYYFMAIMVTVLMLGAMLLLHPLGNYLQKKSAKTTHKLRVVLKNRSYIAQLYNPELEYQAKILSMKFISADTMIVKIEKGVGLDLNQLACEWMTLEGIVSVEQI